MLTIARTLMGSPNCCSSTSRRRGFAPLVVDHLADQILRLKRQGLTILLAEQNVSFSVASPTAFTSSRRDGSATRAGGGAARRRRCARTPGTLGRPPPAVTSHRAAEGGRGRNEQGDAGDASGVPLAGAPGACERDG